MTLSDEERAAALGGLPGWRYDEAERAIRRDFAFAECDFGSPFDPGLGGSLGILHVYVLDVLGKYFYRVNRVAYSEADLAGRAFTLQLFRDAGLTPRIDTAGNIFGRVDGTDRSLKPILIGSHVDSVTDGGNFDGPVGSFSAIEVARSLREQS